MTKEKIFTSLGLFLMLLTGLRGEGLWDDSFAILEAEDVTLSGSDPISLQVWYFHPSGINRESGGGSDLWVASATGFRSGVGFGEWLPLRRLGDTATYRLSAPEGGWRPEQSGEYVVMLVANEIFTNDIEAFPAMEIGSFRVRINEEKRLIPAMAGEITFERFPTPGVPGGGVRELIVANLTATFPFPVEINWGALHPEGEGGFSISVDACEIDGIVPQVVTSYRHSVELGTLGVGQYALALNSGGKEITSESMTIKGGDSLFEGTPEEVNIVVSELPNMGILPAYSAKVRLTYGGFVERSEWAPVNREGGLLSSRMTAWINPDIATFAPTVLEEELSLGMLEPGDYRYDLSTAGRIVGSVNFTVPGVVGGDRTAPLIKVLGAMVTEPGSNPLVFSLEFSDPGGLAIEGIEAQRLTAVNRMGEVFGIERTGLEMTADDAVGAIATCQMQPPGGSWGPEDFGRYRLLLSEPGLVADLIGNRLMSPLVGYLTVEIFPDEPGSLYQAELTVIQEELIGRWTASVRLFVPEALAIRDDWEIAWRQARTVGPSFLLQPRFVLAGSGEEITLIPPLDPIGRGMWVEHDYDLGPISIGRWPVCVESNLGHFAKGLVNAEGGELLPFDFWKARLNPVTGVVSEFDFWEYCVGTDPADLSDDAKGQPVAEWVGGVDGIRHLGLRCQMAIAAFDARLRFQGSNDMLTWVDLGANEIEEVERGVKSGGVEEFVVCLRKGVGQGGFRYLRAVAERW